MYKFPMKLRNSIKALMGLSFNELVYENNPYFENMFLKHALF